MDDALPPQLAPWAIRFANVRFGILPSQTGVRRDDGNTEGSSELLESLAIAEGSFIELELS